MDVPSITQHITSVFPAYFQDHTAYYQRIPCLFPATHSILPAYFLPIPRIAHHISSLFPASNSISPYYTQTFPSFNQLLSASISISVLTALYSLPPRSSLHPNQFISVAPCITQAHTHSRAPIRSFLDQHSREWLPSSGVYTAFTLFRSPFTRASK